MTQKDSLLALQSKIAEISEDIGFIKGKLSLLIDKIDSLPCLHHNDRLIKLEEYYAGNKAVKEYSLKIIGILSSIVSGIVSIIIYVISHFLKI